ncbi:SDR family NAD(P)-dependent oxidoreductase [Nocardioides jishulii]|uniref:SDR family oxidoreductase n=1 Tax=Nocardioides jishulii TaxID=2575440 RepID=A0A4U2YRC6_9ACTN|nr:SDR family NAD(P)-dependent oxidoreductase [Nocardioides jishulii]QCX26524.1 SDR family oxidoreductase [Nocardioides jishulii]TKI63670.1 SDR family oxidoreductase [Nocardioides jishulii]
MTRPADQPTGRVHGKVAVVVGAGQTPGAALGNGRATALLLAREGARVVAVDAHEASAQETADLVAAEGGEAIAVKADVTDEGQVQAAIMAAVEQWGRLDVLHNNVGVSFAVGDAPTTEITPEAFSRVLDINLRGMVLASKHALPLMQAQGEGVITNVSSVAAVAPHPTVAYKTSKAGVLALTDHLAHTHGPDGVRVNALLPGLIDTPMGVERKVGGCTTRDDVVEERRRRSPLQRTGTAWDVAHAALFLASDEARFITGAHLTVDGGLRLAAG